MNWIKRLFSKKKTYNGWNDYDIISQDTPIHNQYISENPNLNDSNSVNNYSKLDGNDSGNVSDSSSSSD